MVLLAAGRTHRLVSGNLRFMASKSAQAALRSRFSLCSSEIKVIRRVAVSWSLVLSTRVELPLSACVLRRLPSPPSAFQLPSCHVLFEPFAPVFHPHAEPQLLLTGATSFQFLALQSTHPLALAGGGGTLTPSAVIIPLCSTGVKLGTAFAHGR